MTGWPTNRSDPRMEDRQDPAPPRLGRADPQDERDRRGEGQQRGRDEHQQHVLDHVDREQRGVVPVDARQQREGEREHPGQERDRPPARDGVGRDGPHRPAGPPTATSRRPRPCRASGAARTSSRAAARPRSAARPGRGRGPAPARPPRAAPRAAPASATISRRVRWIERCPGIGGIVARTHRDDVRPTPCAVLAATRATARAPVEWRRFGPRAVDHALSASAAAPP